MSIRSLQRNLVARHNQLLRVKSNGQPLERSQVAMPNPAAPKIPVSVSNYLSMRRLALCIAFALMLTPLLYSVRPASLQQSHTNVHQTFLQRLSDAAIDRTKLVVRYDSAYVRIPYPDGDVPAGTGVCTDEVIRSYRALGVDIQKEVHEDMQRNFFAYPNQRRWMLAHTDTNIDHRRVPNLQAFFSRNENRCRSLQTSRTINRANSSP